MCLTFREFLQVGKEQYLVQPNLHRKIFVRIFGPLGVHARIRNTRIINHIIRLKLSNKSMILDAGCGHAYATFWLAKNYPNYRFNAIEIDHQLIEDGRYIANKLGLHHISFKKVNALNVHTLSTYDLIFSIDVLEHIEDDISTLKTFRNLLKPNGFLLLHLPRKHQEHRRIIPAFKSHTTPDHVRDEYTADEIKSKLLEAGFEIEYLLYGFGMLGELAFELNYLFWKWNAFRILFALIFHPLSVILAYLDIRRDYDDGNSLIILAKIQNKSKSKDE